MTKDEFLYILSFCILMESNDGILGKAPSYVLEKYHNASPYSLDDQNLAKFRQYCNRWHVDDMRFFE